jgi:phosphopantothenoylcysteine decarboxylase/phosphopantothenate--cysteine ligase
MTTKPEVILGIGGGIAAYKSCDLLRRLQEHGFAVTVVPTPSSLNFVGSATWEALSGRSVTTEVWEKVEEVRHVALAKSAQYAIIAPATADLIARIAWGRADDLLTNLVLAMDVPVLVVPAMHPNMWNNPATAQNVATLRARGFEVMEPEFGRLTGSDTGQGRFPTTENILQRFEALVATRNDFAGKKILITAGGTREPIDPVRYIGNRSSGKQGIALAEAAARRGATVTLILANSHLPVSPRINVVKVETALEMLEEVNHHFDDASVLVMSAAVADARPSKLSSEKIKKAGFTSIDLIENPDILKSLAGIRKGQVIIAFAAETSGDDLSALEKMKSKNADVLYLNNVAEGAIFGQDHTRGKILTSKGTQIEVPEISKDTLADLLLDQALIALG